MKQKEEGRELRLPVEGEVVGLITRLLGNDRVEVKTSDGRMLVCRIPGKLRKRLWFKEGDVVLVAPWEFQAGRGDLLWRYTKDEVEELKRRGLLTGLEKEEL
ncbi:MAG: translation initiation factor eIF-1A [Candidatus Nezhaarchaeota archaeon]|nr:translation initiation factor eIF-1A [Candidatus Nezhaarchaeota archaeon]MCX8141698.1 translation initiation factor eIF-1A [Candidatus Nezhaarchaeota archaeon]MDW8049965.1 translation initiation factor eIF-1A [Nitrososphaerota archaeon]